MHLENRNPMDMRDLSKKSKLVLITALLIILTFGVFWQVRTHDFINFDDGVYVKENPHVQFGLSLQGIKWAFTNFYACHWHPITGSPT